MAAPLVDGAGTIVPARRQDVSRRRSVQRRPEVPSRPSAASRAPDSSSPRPPPVAAWARSGPVTLQRLGERLGPCVRIASRPAHGVAGLGRVRVSGGPGRGARGPPGAGLAARSAKSGAHAPILLVGISGAPGPATATTPRRPPRLRPREQTRALAPWHTRGRSGACPPGFTVSRLERPLAERRLPGRSPPSSLTVEERAVQLGVRQRDQLALGEPLFAMGLAARGGPQRRA